MKNKILKIIDVLAITFILSGIIFILIYCGQTKAYDFKPVKYVWGYAWGPQAVRLYNRLRQIGYTDYSSKLIINKCKKYKPKGGVVNCIIAIAGVAMAESGGFKHCYKGQCMGVKRFGFKTLSANLDDWIHRYNRYWYTWRDKGGAGFFYSINGRPSYSRYCTEEASSGMKKFNCPNGYRAFNYVFKFLIK